MGLYVMMRELIIRIGKNPDADLKDIFTDPHKHAKPGKHILYLKDVEELPSVLSPERLRLLMQLQEVEVDVSTLSKKLHRTQESISRDIKKLAANQLIHKRKKGKHTFIKATYPRIAIEMVGGM